jgi:hypothetical protein
LAAGIADPINMVSNILFGTDTNTFIFIYYSAGYIITLYYLKKKNFGLHHFVIIAIFACAAVAFLFNIFFVSKTVVGEKIIDSAETIPILFTVYNLVYLMSKNMFSTKKLNFYFPLLILLNLFALLRTGTVALQLQAGIEYYIITYFLEGIIGIYFIFFDIKNSPQIPLAGKRVNTGSIEP